LRPILALRSVTVRIDNILGYDKAAKFPEVKHPPPRYRFQPEAVNLSQ
jgi:hypothetical protein